MQKWQNVKQLWCVCRAAARMIGWHNMHLCMMHFFLIPLSLATTQPRLHNNKAAAFNAHPSWKLHYCTTGKFLHLHLISVKAICVEENLQSLQLSYRNLKSTLRRARLPERRFYLFGLQESSRHCGVFKIIYYEQGYTPLNTWGL